MNRPTMRQRRMIKAAAVPAALLASALVVWQGSYAAFSATTNDAANNWATGNVSLTDDDGGSAMFNAVGLRPGSTGTKCIKVTSNSSLFGPVKLYTTSASTNSLANYIDVTVAEGTPGDFTSCGAFVGSSIYSGTLTAMPSTYGTGAGTWTPSTNPESKTYKFTYTVNAAAPSSVMNSTASATFTWEIQA